MGSNDGQCEYRVVIETESVELASTLLATLTDCLGTELVDEEVEAQTETGEQRHEAGTVVAYYEHPRPEAAPEIRAEVDDALRRLENTHWRIARCERFTDEDWKEKWKEYFEPLQLSARVGVGPPWRAEEIPEPKGGTSLVIEPGMAFGTGQHETTKLAARLLDDGLVRATSRSSVLDVGCGSGILAMAAARLGAAPVRGIDVDADAVAAARENLRRNDLEEEVEVSTTPLEAVEATYDIVVANILAPVLMELRDGLFERVDSHGQLLVSGVTLDRAEPFLASFLPADWRVAERPELGDWAGYALEAVERENLRD